MSRERLDWLVTATMGRYHRHHVYEAKLVGVFDEPMRANRLLGLLVGWNEVRSVVLARVGQDGGHVFEWVYISPGIADEYWASDDGYWEQIHAHEVEIIQWHKQRREMHRQGVDWMALVVRDELSQFGTALSLADRIPASNAAYATSGQCQELLNALDE